MSALNKMSSDINGVPSLEGRFILKLLRGLIFEKDSIRQLNWQYLFETTEYHRITSLIFFDFEQKVSKGISKGMSELLLEKLNMRFNSDISKNEKTYELWYLLLEIQCLTDIKIIYMEDFVLKHCVYPRPEFREMNHIDIWVNHQDINKIFSYLKERGFSVSSKNKNNSDPYYKISLAPDNNNKINVKFHYFLPQLPFYSFYKETKPYINYTVELNINNFMFSTVQSEYLLLHILIKLYMYKKLEFTLRDLLDIKFLTQKGVNSTIDMVNFTHIVKHLGLQEPTYFWFKLISYIFQTNHLDYVLNEISFSVRDTIKHEVRHISDNIDLFLKPGKGYISKLKAMFLVIISSGLSASVASNLFSLLKEIILISQEDFEKLYLERINDNIDSRLRYFYHIVRLFKNYSLWFVE
ncbi:nucleotidyltransferase family protein [Nostoc commune]|uniref:nucleotidyltransferase family protein n=1 Tax=Nostoc commune TaxID=1178 RepID=UPI0018C4B669|nr:nucleotidyltransferase family protein [Nostoc commune]MBG1261241.1 nucleotidyltransferase family protein [Nostoc commune BAE]